MTGSLKEKISKACKGKIRLTLKQKAQIASMHHHEDPQQRKTSRQLAEQFGISERSVRLVSAAKYQDKIASFKTGGCNTDEVRIVRAEPHPQLTDKLIKWIETSRQTLNPASGAQSTITTALLQEKAVEFAQELGLKDFKATKGWVYRWRQRFQKRKEVNEQPETMEKEYVNMVLARLESLTRDLMAHSRMIPDSVHLASKLKHAFLRETKHALEQSQARSSLEQSQQLAQRAVQHVPPPAMMAQQVGLVTGIAPNQLNNPHVHPRAPPPDLYQVPSSSLQDPSGGFRW